MSVEYIDFEEARTATGLRMIVVSGVPSPWGEAAKGILHTKQIPWKAVRLDTSNPEMLDWIQADSGPVAIFDEESPRSGWAEILLLAERLAPTPALLPSDPLERAKILGLSHEICGEGGLGWVRRLSGIHAGLQGGPGFPPPVAQYLGEKYGYRAEEESGYETRIIELLTMLSGLLNQEKKNGSTFYSGGSVTALDFYSATFMALFKPLPQEHCPMPEALRPAFELMSDSIEKAFDPILLEHRDRIYRDFMELPLSL